VPGEETVVRPIVASDVAAVACAHLAAWQRAFRGILSDALLDGLRVEEREVVWRQIVQAQDRTTLVAERDGAVLGYVGFGPPHDCDRGLRQAGEIYGIYVHPDHWRRGIGGALLSQATAQLKQADYARVLLWTTVDNATARAFYARNGFSADGAERTSERHGEQF
jgi:ribosomal protein S18 acetylase RimI-like enzyme